MIDYPSEIGLDLDSLVENGYFCFHILCERSWSWGISQKQYHTLNV